MLIFLFEKMSATVQAAHACNRSLKFSSRMQTEKVYLVPETAMMVAIR
jgi:hypothetical protein